MGRVSIFRVMYSGFATYAAGGGSLRGCAAIGPNPAGWANSAGKSRIRWVCDGITFHSSQAKIVSQCKNRKVDLSGRVVLSKAETKGSEGESIRDSHGFQDVAGCLL
jgi:hypothetical protein